MDWGILALTWLHGMIYSGALLVSSMVFLGFEALFHRMWQYLNDRPGNTDNYLAIKLSDYLNHSWFDEDLMLAFMVSLFLIPIWPLVIISAIGYGILYYLRGIIRMKKNLAKTIQHVKKLREHQEREGSDGS